jgi:hypothetical protein
MPADRTNRWVLGSTGLLLAGAGAAGLLAGVGVFGEEVADRALFDNAAGEFFGRNGTWLWPVLAVAGAVLLIGALLWLRRQLLPDRAGDLPLASGPRGRTELTSAALTDAVTAEIGSYRGVDTARARLHGDTEDPELAVAVTLEDRADLLEVRRRVETEALAAARQALGRDVPIRLDLDVSPAGRRVS